MPQNEVSRCSSCDGMDRRSFLSAAALAAITLALAACSDTTGPELSGPSTIKVSDYPALAATNGVATLRLNGSPLAVVHTGANDYLALSLVCPHQGATVGVISSGFQCPRHGARFTTTGAWAGGQQTSNLRSYPTTFDAATGALTIG